MKKLNAIVLLAFVCVILGIYPFGANAQYTKLLDFVGAANGSAPNGNLISVGTFLYGMTGHGGTKDSGIIFKIMPNGSGYSKLFDFSSANGYYPIGTLISDGTFLYGMTGYGGTNNMGVVFKIKPNGTGYVKLLDFAGTTNGSNPRGSLFSDGFFLYGMTRVGGTNNMGVLFKIKPDGTGYIDLLDFSAATGEYPRGSLISDGVFLYGMTYIGGTYNYGTIFKIKPDGSSYVKLYDFGTAGDGSSPCGSFISDGTFLYGMTLSGGTIGYGTIFKIKPDGTGYVKLHNFGTAGDGSSSYGSFISDGTFLYGMTFQGGTNYVGTIFKIMLNGTGYVKLLDFAGITNGSNPYGSLISDGTFLYGMTAGGGTNNLGTVFKFRDSTAICNASITGNTAICSGQTTTLIASGGANYSWITSQTTASITISPSTSTTYTVTATTGTCVATETVTVVVNPLPNIVVSSNCQGNTVCLNDSCALTVTGGVFYSWSTNQTSQSIFVAPIINTTYSVVGTDGNGCSASSSFPLVVDNLSISSITSTNASCSSCPDGSATVNPSGGFPAYTYQWFPAGQNTQTISNLPPGTYSVCVSDANGCSSCDTATVNFTIGIQNFSELQNVFILPNPTSGSFQLTAGNMQLTKGELEIYNVMGEKMYSTIINSQSLIINLDAPNGIYFLQIKTEQGMATKKIVISH